jgi:hypothetical protein
MDTGVETAAARFIHPDALTVPANDPIKDPTMKSRLRIAISSSALNPFTSGFERTWWSFAFDELRRE